MINTNVTDKVMGNIQKISQSQSSDEEERRFRSAQQSERMDIWSRHHGFGKRHMRKMIDCVGYPEWVSAYDKAKEQIGSGGTVCLIGPRGTGKTQLAFHLVRNFFSKNDSSESAWRSNSVSSAAYWTALDFFMIVKETYGNNDISEVGVVKDLSNMPILVIDEIQVRSETAWENSMLTHLIDRRYRNMKDTILISNQTNQAFVEGVGPSIADRIRETGGIIEMKWASIRQCRQEYPRNTEVGNE